MSFHVKATGLIIKHELDQKESDNKERRAIRSR